MKYKVIISGGGTGGHIFPAIAIANQIKEQMPEAEILFVGAMGRMEMEKVPAAGYRIIGLPVAGLQRKALHKNLTLPFKLLKSVYHAQKIIRDFQPNVAVGVGGYASGPLLWVASRKGIPCVIQEQNSYPGITNKLLAKRVQTICVAYPNMEHFFPKEKIRLTGNPVRNNIVPVNEMLKQEGRAYFGINPTHRCIIILGGSLGARTLNDCVKKYVLKLYNEQDVAKQETIEQDVAKYVVTEHAVAEHVVAEHVVTEHVVAEHSGKESSVELIWQCGDFYRKEIEAFVSAHPHPCVHLHPFINRMDLAYAAADVVISRSGACTISELCIAGKAVIFVPSPNVSEDHQTKNAMALVSQHAALIVPEKEAEACLMTTAIDLSNDEAKRRLLVSNIAALARPNATRDIVGQLIVFNGQFSGNGRDKKRDK